MASKQLMATLAGGVAIFFLGFLLYGVLLMDFFLANTGSATGVMREVPTWWALVVGQVLTAALLVMIMGWRGDASAGAALKTGALVGLIWALSVDFTFYGTTNSLNLTATLVDPIVFMIQLGITGAVVGALLGRGSTPAATTD